MGNRAIITTKEEELGIYLHWNGGLDTIKPLLEYCKRKGYRSPQNDPAYAFARFCQVTGNFLGGSLSMGVIIGKFNPQDYDNGIYYIGANWEIVDRAFPYNTFKEQQEYDFYEMLESIDKSQPKDEQLGNEILFAKQISLEDLKLNDTVYIKDNFKNKYEKFKIEGFGSDIIVNGTSVKGLPYIKKYTNKNNNINLDNINNYLREDTHIYIVKE